jgi:hypothetical protein
MRFLKGRARFEKAEASGAGILRILTIIWHNSIEVLTGWDPMITVALWNGS